MVIMSNDNESDEAIYVEKEVGGGGEKHDISIDIDQIDVRDRKVPRSIDDDINDISNDMASNLVIEDPFYCEESIICLNDLFGDNENNTTMDSILSDDSGE